MAASPNLNTLSPSHHAHTQPHPTSKRRKNTATTPASVSSDASDGAWCCAPTSSLSDLPRRHPSPSPSPPLSLPTTVSSPSPHPVAASPPMDPSSPAAYPSSYVKFNSALNAGLLNPMSPPRSSPTLFDMMASEQDYHPKTAAAHRRLSAASAQDCQLLLEERLAEILGGCSPGNQFNDPNTSDVHLTLSSRDGASVSLNVHRHILVAHSRFFAAKLSDRWSMQQRSLPHLVDISDCDDVAVYIETLRLMYSKDLRRRLMREDVSKVLGILKVSAAISFDAGVLSCLEYLEAAPWAEHDEEKVASLLSQLHLETSGAGEVLKRVSIEEAPSSTAAANGNVSGGSGQAILLRLLQVVLEGKDEKARREMKGLLSKMLRENNAAPGGCGQGSFEDLSKESLYSACGSCLRLLRQHFLLAATSDMSEAAQIQRQADNLHWILDILIDRQTADEFLKNWASEAELAEAHERVPAIHRHEVSRVTARLFVGIGKGQILAAKEARTLLLRTWLEPFYEDFGWMRRACRGLDRHLIEDGLGNTILTLPLAMQQEILIAWFDRFLNSGDDCPNIQRAFEVWWRRAFWRRNGEPNKPSLLRIAANCDKSS